MATTTNYSWSTPDDTALVKDGAAAIRSLGTAIDSTVFTNAGAAINKTIVDAKGDIIAATAADTVSRLAVGANDTVLTADSSTATGLKWAAASAGGMTLISTTSLTGASVTLSSIPSTYQNLRLIFRNPLVATLGATIRMRVNGDSNANRHRSVAAMATAPALAFNSTSWDLFFENDNTVGNGLGEVIIFDYANATSWKIMRVFSVGVDYNNSAQAVLNAYANIYNQTTAISSLVIFPSSGNWTSGTVELYGVK